MTANDSDVSDGDTLTGSQVVRVYGQNLTSPFVTLTFGDVQYTPLTQGEGYIEFILGDNGTATINVDGSPIMSFEVEGIEVPEGLPNYFRMAQMTSASSLRNLVEIDNIKCINYPHAFDENYPIFWLSIGKASNTFVDINIESWGFENCQLRDLSLRDNVRTTLRVEVIDQDKVAYITYKNFIVAVFNYTTD